MDDDTLLYYLIQRLSDATDGEVKAQDIHLDTNLELDLGLDDECLDFILIELQADYLTLPDLSGIVLREFPTVEAILEAIVSRILSE